MKNVIPVNKTLNSLYLGFANSFCRVSYSAGLLILPVIYVHDLFFSNVAIIGYNHAPRACMPYKHILKE